MKNSKFSLALKLFIDYFKIGLFTFGGGLSMISLIQKTFVEKRKFITDDELLLITAISESTPGVIAINTATYIGYKVSGFLGSLFATLGVVLPSFMIILVLSYFYERFIEIKIISYLIMGLSVGVTFLLFRAGYKVYKAYKKNWLSYIIIALSFISILLIKLLKLNFSSIYVILIGGFLSLIYHLISFKKTNDYEEENK
ncbi:chromate transporter [bacterium]|nr:chromate transporter [bacterium]